MSSSLNCQASTNPLAVSFSGTAKSYTWLSTPSTCFV